MIEISFLAGELVFAAIWIVVRILVWIKQKKVNWKREAMLLLMFVNLAVIIRFVFYPFDRVDGRILPLIFDVNRILPFRINPVPFVHILEYDTRSYTIINIAGNAGLFIPSGILFPILYKRLDRFWKVVVAGACLSLSIEIIQLLFVNSVTDMDDLIMNTAGCAIGYGIYALVRKLAHRRHTM